LRYTLFRSVSLLMVCGMRSIHAKKARHFDSLDLYTNNKGSKM
jgi:hypothetical protein